LQGGRRPWGNIKCEAAWTVETEARGKTERGCRDCRGGKGEGKECKKTSGWAGVGEMNNSHPARRLWDPPPSGDLRWGLASKPKEAKTAWVFGLCIYATLKHEKKGSGEDMVRSLGVKGAGFEVAPEPGLSKTPLHCMGALTLSCVFHAPPSFRGVGLIIVLCRTGESMGKGCSKEVRISAF